MLLLFIFLQSIQTIASLIVTQTDSPLIWIHRCRESMIVLTEFGSIYKSSNNGTIWERQQEIFDRAAILAGDIEEQQHVYKLQANENNPDQIIFFGKQAISWITPDCVSTLQGVVDYREFQFNKKDEILASKWNKCEGCSISNKLYLSQDFGENWIEILNYVHQFSWYKGDKLLAIYNGEQYGNQSFWVTDYDLIEMDLKLMKQRLIKKNVVRFRLDRNDSLIYWSNKQLFINKQVMSIDKQAHHDVIQLDYKYAFICEFYDEYCNLYRNKTLIVSGLNKLQLLYDYYRLADNILVVNTIKNKTLISYDNGDSWNELEQYFNMQTQALDLPPMYSQGQYVFATDQNNNTYLSIDFGLNWNIVGTKPYIYEIYQDILVMGLYNVITDHILYSTNDGKDWNLYYFDDLQIIIKNILKGFIIYGTTIEGYGIMIQLDLPSHNQSCKQDQIIIQTLTNQCYNGYQLQYYQKQYDCVLNKDTYWKQPCECTQEDYQCDEGFTQEDQLCVGTYEQQEQCQEQWYWIEKSGYIKMNECQDGLEYQNKVYRCGSFNYLVIIMIIIICIILFFVLRRYYLKERQDEQIRREAEKSRMIFDDE